MTVDFRFYLITDRTQCKSKPLIEVVAQACQAGVRAIQLREKDLSPLELYDLARDIKLTLDAYKCRLLINDRADIACAVGADGVQLTEKSVPAYEAKKCMANKPSLVGVSTHSLDGVIKAEASGADFALLGPIFYTKSKAQYGPPLGLKLLEAAAKTAKLPLFAVGGINPLRAKDCLNAGAYGIAAISAVMSAKDVFSAVKEFEAAMGSL